MPLAFADAGAEVELKELRGDEAFRRHMESLGLIKGSKVTVISKNSGNMIIGVKGSRLGINKATANKIII